MASFISMFSGVEEEPIDSTPPKLCLKRRQCSNRKCWDDLSSKLQKDVLSHLDHHDLLKCRLVSKSLQSHAGEVLVDVLKLDPSLKWNPYFPAVASKSSDVRSGPLLGLIRFHSAAEVKQFLERNSSQKEKQKHVKFKSDTTAAAVSNAEAQPKAAAEPKAAVTVTVLSPQKVPSMATSGAKTQAPLTLSPKRPSTVSTATSGPKATETNLLQKRPSTASATGPNSHFGSHLRQQNSINVQKPSPTSTEINKSTSTKVPTAGPKTTSNNSPSNTASTRKDQKMTASASPTGARNYTNRNSYTARAKLKNKFPPKSLPVKSTAQVKSQQPSASTNCVNSNNNNLSNISKQLVVTTTGQPEKVSPFPLGAVYIRRNFQEDSTALNIVNWTKRLVYDYGEHLTSLTFDDGRGLSKSDLTFDQLHSILSQLPNLVYLGIMAANYEHHINRGNQQQTPEEEEVQILPALEHLKIVSLGYNASYHLHMDILNAYGCQLTRLICSKFGYFVRSPFGNLVSTNNSLQKLLEFGNSIKSVQPCMLSSLEELKVPVISSQCLVREVEQAATSHGHSHSPSTQIQWSNLKRLSLFYIYRGDEYSDCCLADIWTVLNTFSATLEELFLDFQSCSDFVEWISNDERPFALPVLQPCEKVKKMSISSVTFLRSDDMAGLICSKFPNLKVLTFFNWASYYSEAIQQNNMHGNYFSGGPTPVTIPGHIGYFWKDLPLLQQVSIRTNTWSDDCIYLRNRNEMSFIPKNGATYIY